MKIATIPEHSIVKLYLVVFSFVRLGHIQNFKPKLIFGDNFLISIIAGASADASADESLDKFLKKTVFFTLFLIFLNSQPIQSLSKARSDPYWEEQSLQKINQSNTVFKQFLNSFFCHSLNCFDSFKYSSPPACIFRV